MKEEKLSLRESFRRWLWGHPERDQLTEADQERAFLHHENEAHCRRSMHHNRIMRNRVRNRMQKLSRRINWGLV